MTESNEFNKKRVKYSMKWNQAEEEWALNLEGEFVSLCDAMA